MLRRSRLLCGLCSSVRAFGVSSAAPLPPPLEIEDNGACYIVKDKNGQALAYVYFEEEPWTVDDEN